MFAMINPDTQERIDTKDIFGKDTDKLKKNCKTLFEKSLHFCKPEEEDRYLKAIYGIAKRHYVYVRWFGRGSCCCPDQFEVMKRGKRVGRICLL